MKRHLTLFLLIALSLLSCRQPQTSATDDSSRFVNLADAVPDTYFTFPVSQL